MKNQLALGGQTSTPETTRYTYDAWGNILTATGDLANINPIRFFKNVKDDGKVQNMLDLSGMYYDYLKAVERLQVL